MTSTGARLRQTFKYPTDSESSDASREELDEEGEHFRNMMSYFGLWKCMHTVFSGLGDRW